MTKLSDKLNAYACCHNVKKKKKNPASIRRDIFPTPYVVERKELTHSPACWTPLPLRCSATNISYFTFGRDYGCAPIVNQSGKATLDICSIMSNMYRFARKVLTGLL